MTFVHTNFKWVGICLLTILLTYSIVGAEEELNKIKFFQEMQKRKLPVTGPTDDPPPQPALAVAEWEPATGVLITYPLAIPLELVADMAEVVEVMTEVVNESAMQQAINDYVHAGVDTSKCTFLFIGQSIGPYTRDHGPWYIFNGDDEQGMISNNYFQYNWIVPALGDTLGIPVYETGLQAEGGNYMTDGMGTCITTDYTYWGNEPLTPEQIDGIFEEYLGINNLRTVPDPFNNWVPHIDCHAKFLDPGRIIVIEVDPPNPIIEENVVYWSTLMSGYGRPYEILRIPGLGYANSLFLNDNVFVALSGDPIGDSTAVATFSAALPGYTVEGYPYPSFMFLDALHCRTHEMADRYMLRIVHVPVHDLENTGGGYYLEADIHPYSNEPLIGPPVIMWKADGGSYSPVALTFAGDDIYYGEIPQQPDGTDIYYYLEAEDGSGRVENHPYIGPGDPHHFHVGPDTEVPMVDFRPPETLLAPEWPLTFTTYALDDRWISSVTLEHSINGIPQDDADMPLEEPYAVYYTGTPTSTVQPGDIIEVRVKAIDTSVNQNTTYSPYYTISVESAPDVTVALTYNYGSPVPAGGGYINFDASLQNNEISSVDFDLWVEIPPELLPPDVPNRSLTFTGGFSIVRPGMDWPIPADWPAGNYDMIWNVGDLASLTVWSSDSFPFEKSFVDDGSGFALREVEGDPLDQLFEDVDLDQSAAVSEFALLGNYPNPFNPTTVLSYKLQAASRVNLAVYDISGRKVAELVEGYRDAGIHEVTFDASNLASGVYIYRFEAGDFNASGKMVLMK